MFIYFARPIDQAGESSFLGSLEMTIRRKLELAGVGAYLPHLAYQALTTDRQHTRFIQEINQYALFSADAMLAILPAGVATLGVPAEIERALILNKSIVLFTDLLGSVQVAAWEDAGVQVINLADPDATIPESLDLLAMLRPSTQAANELEERSTFYVRYEEGASPLTKAHQTDAGFDLATLHEATLHSGERVMVRTGVSGSVPDGWWGQITARSSTRSRWQVQVHDAVIDAGYTGELMIGVTYKGIGSVVIPAGTRLAQYVLHLVWQGNLEVTHTLPESARGDSGYGSSGH